jgi:hypothetical protein
MDIDWQVHQSLGNAAGSAAGQGAKECMVCKIGTTNSQFKYSVSY